MRLKLILRGKRLGLALSEIGELLDLYEVRRNERAQLAAFLALLAERRVRLLQQREDIEAAQRALTRQRTARERRSEIR